MTGNVNFNPAAAQGPDFNPEEYLKSMGIPENVIAQGDDAVRKYAEENGIKLAPKGQPPQQPGMGRDEGLLQFSGDGADFKANPFGAIGNYSPEQLKAYLARGAKIAGCTIPEFIEMVGIPPEYLSTVADTEEEYDNTEKYNPTQIDSTERLSRRERKEWIKNYMAEHNCSKKEAKKAFEQEYQIDMMSRKDAKEWCQNYMNENGCSKKEAKEAFERTFGYKVPMSAFQKNMRALFGPINIARLAITGSDETSSYLEGIRKDDAVYQKKS